MSYIKIKNLEKRFADFVALKNLNAEIEKGEIFGLLGENGAGKTTLVRIICGVLKPSSGTVYIDSLDIRKHALEIKKKIGYLPEEPNIYLRMHAYDFLRFFGEIYGINSDAIDKRIYEVLDFLGLKERAKTKIAGFSKGMRQRLAIARALLHDPEILILDEPTMGLDPAAAYEIRRFILSLKGRKTIILATHYLDEAEILCDRIAIMHNGSFAAIGRIEDLKKSVEKDIGKKPSLEEVFINIRKTCRE